MSRQWCSRDKCQWTKCWRWWISTLTLSSSKDNFKVSLSSWMGLRREECPQQPAIYPTFVILCCVAFPSKIWTGWIAHVINSSTQEADRGKRIPVQVQPGIYSKFQDNQNYIDRHCQNKNKNTQKTKTKQNNNNKRPNKQKFFSIKIWTNGMVPATEQRILWWTNEFMEVTYRNLGEQWLVPPHWWHLTAERILG